MTSHTSNRALTETLRRFVSLVRLEHALFSLPLFISGALLAGPGRFPSWLDWLYIAVAGTSARNLALALNRFIDRHIDSRNPRTSTRELPAGRLNTLQVQFFIALNLVLYAVSAWLIAPICLVLGWIPLAIFTLYPFMKRFTSLCHFGVGAGLAMAPLGGYLAAAKEWPLSVPAWLLAGFTFLWVSGFDIIYATMDETFDRAHGVHSMVAWLGRERALRVSAVLHVIAFAALVGTVQLVLGPTPPVIARIVSGVLLAAAGVLLFLEQRWAEQVNLAFFKVNVWVGAVVLLAVLAARIGG